MNSQMHKTAFDIMLGMPGMPCLDSSGGQMISSIQCRTTSLCVAERQQDGYLILDAALISFMAALTR